MKNNINNKPSLSSLSLAQFSVENRFDGKFSFSGTFFLGRKKDNQEMYGGEFTASDATFSMSESSAKKLEQLVLSLENDLAMYLFEELEKEDNENSENKKEILEDTDDRFLI